MIASLNRHGLRMSSSLARKASDRVLLFDQSDSDRLKKVIYHQYNNNVNNNNNKCRQAKLRLAEAQGVIPIGASQSDSFDSSSVVPNLSKVTYNY